MYNGIRARASFSSSETVAKCFYPFGHDFHNKKSNNGKHVDRRCNSFVTRQKIIYENYLILVSNDFCFCLRSCDGKYFTLDHFPCILDCLFSCLCFLECVCVWGGRLSINCWKVHYFYINNLNWHQNMASSNPWSKFK